LQHYKTHWKNSQHQYKCCLYVGLNEHHFQRRRHTLQHKPARPGGTTTALGSSRAESQRVSLPPVENVHLTDSSTVAPGAETRGAFTGPATRQPAEPGARPRRRSAGHSTSSGRGQRPGERGKGRSPQGEFGPRTERGLKPPYTVRLNLSSAANRL